MLGPGRRVAQPGQPGDPDAGLAGPAQHFVLGAVGQQQQYVQSGRHAADPHGRAERGEPPDQGVAAAPVVDAHPANVLVIVRRCR